MFFIPPKLSAARPKFRASILLIRLDMVVLYFDINTDKLIK